MRCFFYKCSSLAAVLALLMTAASQAAVVYVVNDVGRIKSFSGVGAGSTPLAGQSFATGGTLLNTVEAYGAYQGFTSTPDGKVYGINPEGDVISWSTVGAWVNAVPGTIESTGAYGTKTVNVAPSAGGDGSVHGISYDGNTGGFYVTYEDDENASGNVDGDIGEYATLSDFINNTNATISASVYGGNTLNFWYPDEDAPSNRNAPNDTPGANYFQVAGNGQLEGFLTLADYIADPNNRTFQQAGFGNGAAIRGAFAVIPEPSSIALVALAVGGCLIYRRRC